MNGLDKKYASLLEEAERNPDILGLMWWGSRGKGEEFITKDSDYDVCVITSDVASDGLKKKLGEYRSPDFEIFPKTLTEFKNHAVWGSEEDWNRYNFAHNIVTLDKTGELQKLVDEKGVLPKNVQREVIERAIDDYINQVYRSAKHWRDGNALAAYLDATESLPPLMTALYGLEGRLKPYNKYFAWELKNHPLKFLPWSADELISDYKHILETGDMETQKKIFTAVKQLFQEQGYSKAIEGWKGYYLVG